MVRNKLCTVQMSRSLDSCSDRVFGNKPRSAILASTNQKNTATTET